jgi:thiol-disulfide isomerase/thioredoxin
MRFSWVVAALTLLTLAMPAAQAAANVPRPSPDFAINLGQGKQVRISQFKGKTVVVAFILTYCSHCQKTISVLSKVQKDYGERGLQVLASATEDMAAAALPGFLRQFDPPFPVGVNTTSEFVTYMQHPTMLQLYMPGLVFIDKNGMIQAQYEGRDAFLEENSVEKNIRAKVEAMLAPSAAPKKAVSKKASPKKSN